MGGCGALVETGITDMATGNSNNGLMIDIMASADGGIDRKSV